jgi:hypothetical protein
MTRPNPDDPFPMTRPDPNQILFAWKGKLC